MKLNMHKNGVKHIWKNSLCLAPLLLLYINPVAIDFSRNSLAFVMCRKRSEFVYQMLLIIAKHRCKLYK